MLNGFSHKYAKEIRKTNDVTPFSFGEEAGVRFPQLRI